MTDKEKYKRGRQGYASFLRCDVVSVRAPLNVALRPVLALIDRGRLASVIAPVDLRLV
jgi:hypothetical protein